jgi:hypothetical protein
METPTVTSKNLPGAKPPAVDNLTGKEAQSILPPPAVDYAEIPDELIEARPLVDPGWAEIKWKNSNLSGRWVYCHGERGGLRFQEMRALGFRAAKDTDAEVPGVLFEDGVFRKGDTVLMVMDKSRYLGALKFKEEQSLIMAGRRKRSNQVRPAGKDPRTGEVVFHGKKGKLVFFEPNAEELEALESTDSDTPQRRSDVLNSTISRLVNR